MHFTAKKTLHLLVFNLPRLSVPALVQVTLREASLTRFAICSFARSRNYALSTDLINWQLAACSV
jgi:hypothetical protein